ncbi:MAG: TrkH family potassium uptake protein [Deinococcus sp.]|nr:TrkH family potassium uptake protein [Deinococcus sp.]
MRYSPASSSPLPRVTLYILGLTYMGLGGVMALMALAGLVLGQSWLGFLAGAAIGLTLGALFRGVGASKTTPRRAESLFAVALLWLAVPLLGAVPFWISGGMSYLDALFESMSGFTTTGATALADFKQFDQTLFFWRSLIQWFGGVGVLVLFIAVLPSLAVAGRQLFFAESTGVQKEAITPRLSDTARAVLKVYVLLTVSAALAYGFAGVPWFEAISNALTTIPAAGFSPNPMSFANYTPAAQWFGVIFMFLGGASFVLQFQLFFRREARPVITDPEFRAYFAIVLVAGLVLSGYLYAHNTYGLEASLRHAFFQVTSLITTTGYASADFAQWVLPAQAILVAVMFVGGCAGSGAGGIKVVRWLVVGALVRRELQRTLHPQAVLPLRIGNKTFGEDVLRSVAAFITLYALLFAVSALALALLEGNLVVAFTASAAAIGNIGPGLEQIGPMGNYAGLHPVSKLILITEMWAGRIELISVFLLLTPELWRKLRS